MSNSESHSQNNFNILRLILASSVIFSHAPVLLDGNLHREPLFWIFQTLTLGQVAVDGFFLLSGYLIVKSWAQDPHPTIFLRKRILRIYPGFIAASFVSAVIVGALGSKCASCYFEEFSVFDYLKSLFLLRVPAVPPVFDGTSYPSVNGSVWTIFFEFLCYMGTLALGVAGGIRNRRIWGGCTVVGIVLLALHGSGVQRLGPVDFSHQLFRFIPTFLIGGSFYLYRNEIKFNKLAATLSGITLCFSMFHPKIAELAFVLAGGYLLFFFAFLHTPSLFRFNSTPDISYGVYLYAWPIKKLILWYFPTISLSILLALSVIASMALGIASWKFIESPFMKLKGKRIRSTRHVVA